MGLTSNRLINGIIKLICGLIFIWGGVPAISHAQLGPGDAAFTGFNADERDAFSVVVFKDITGNSEIHFSSEEWSGSDFTGPGGDFTWVAPNGGISKGTVLVFNDVGDTPSVNIGTITDDANMNLSGSGDVIYAYTGDDKSTSDAFLGAIATQANEYNNTDGSLDNTGLDKGTTAILLDDNIDGAKYIGDRSGNTPNGYLDLLNDVGSESASDDNWLQVNGSGDQSGQILSFDDTSFQIINPPTVHFSASSGTVTEDGGSATLTVELAEANGDAVTVDVAFLSSSSSADGSDINYSTQTVSFSSSDDSGTQKTVTVDITDDDKVEGDERAVFQLQDNTNDAIISPENFTLTITDNDAPEVVINEILYSPSGDANNDGTESTTDDEFVELVNNSNRSLDISNWTLSDGLNGGTVRYTFKTGTIIPSQRAFVVFSEPAEGSGFGGAYLFSPGGTLSLNNSGDDVIIKDADGNVVTSYHYDGSESGESITRNPDITGSFEAHTSADSDDNSPFSPGTHIDGTAFGGGYAIGIRGTEGWRFVATPTQSTSFSDLFEGIWTQGIPGSDAASMANANLFSWQEPGGGTFNTIGDMSDNLTPGKGYIIFVYADDYRAPGTQGGFPKVINTDKTENSSVSVPVSSNDADGSGSIDGNEGYNLLGNPFGTDISVDAVISALQDAASSATVNANVYIWNNDKSGGADYEIRGSGDTIAPFQAFFVRYESDNVSATVNFDKSNLAANQGTKFYKQASEDKESFQLQLGQGDLFNSYEVEFNEDGKIGEDRLDAYKLFSLDDQTVRLYSTVDNGVKLAKNVLPPVDELDGELRIPLRYQVPVSGEYTFSWKNVDHIPNNIKLYLVDNESGQKIDMRSANSFKVNLAPENKKTINGKTSAGTLPSIQEDNTDSNNRFEIVAETTSSQDNSNQEEQTADVIVSPNYPNPFSSQTSMDLELKSKMHVRVTVWNIVGQKIATLADRMMDENAPPLTWNVPGNMPSGIYICKIEAGGKVFTRKMTLVK